MTTGKGAHQLLDTLDQDELDDLRATWLSRRMFGFLLRPEIAPYYIETRTFEEYVEAVYATR